MNRYENLLEAACEAHREAYKKFGGRNSETKVYMKRIKWCERKLAE